MNRVIRSSLVIGTFTALLLAGCSGGADSHDGADGSSAGTSMPDAPAAIELKVPTADELAAMPPDPTRQWGPDVQPDRYGEPLKFLYWRVDELFRTLDQDGDSMLTIDEFTGEDVNFTRIDADGDGLLIKKEVIADMIPRLQQNGQLP